MKKGEVMKERRERKEGWMEIRINEGKKKGRKRRKNKNNAEKEDGMKGGGQDWKNEGKSGGMKEGNIVEQRKGKNEVMKEGENERCGERIQKGRKKGMEEGGKKKEK